MYCLNHTTIPELSLQSTQCSNGQKNPCTDSQVHINFISNFHQLAKYVCIRKDQISVITSLHHLFRFNLSVLVAHHYIHSCLRVLLTYTRHHRVTNFQGYNILRILWIFQNLKIVRFTSSVVYFLLILNFFHKILRKNFESLKLLPYSELQLSHPSCEIHKHQ